MKTTKCDKCCSEIRNCNYKKHYSVCDRSGPYKPLTCCKWCNKLFVDGENIPNHSRWCLQNPKSAEYKKVASSGNNWKYITKDSRIKAHNGIRLAHASGKYDTANKNKKGKPGTKKTDEQKEAARQKALASPHRRLVRSIRNYTKKDGTIVKLDSSWEEALAIRLDQLNVDWSRPEPIKWIDRSGVYHNYFPDFYLTLFDIFLDPKNPQALRVQKDKIECLTEQITNLIIITSLKDCKTFTP
jgi:hypothetical protein